VARFCPRSVLASVSFLVVASTPLVAQSPSYDIVIRHGHVLDGRGNPWIAADVGIRDGRIVKIGVVPGTGKQEIDAPGK
jgi:N-acyl-D-amino-acid deacylase